MKHIRIILLLASIAPPLAAQMRVNLGVQVSTATGVPTVTWTAQQGAAQYTVERWRPDNPACCRTVSKPQSGTTWTDVLVPGPGTYVYRVTVQFPDGRTGYNDLQTMVGGGAAAGGAAASGNVGGAAGAMAGGGAAGAAGAAGSAGGGAGASAKGILGDPSSAAAGGAAAGAATAAGAAASGAAGASASGGAGAMAGGGAAAATYLANPTGFSAEQTGPGQVRLSWRPVSGAAGYVLLGPGLPRGGVTVQGTTFDIGKLTGGAQRWWVGSVTSAGVSGPSASFALVDFVVK